MIFNYHRFGFPPLFFILFLISYSSFSVADNDIADKISKKNGGNSTTDVILNVLYFPVKLFLPHYEERKILYNIETEYHWISIEMDDQGKRHLIFNPHKGSQSIWIPEKPDKVYSNYLKTMLLALALGREKPGRMLFLGMGGGIMPRYLRKFYPYTIFDIIEIDEKIPEIAEKYFGFKKDNKMNLIIEDGRYYVNKCTEKYDFIFLDIYNSEGIPFEFTTREFFLHLEKLLSPDGVLSINLANLGKGNFIQNEIKTVSSVFKKIALFLCENQTNYVAICSKNANFAEKEFREKIKSRDLKYDFGYDYNAYYETRLSEEKIGELISEDAVILTDDYAPNIP